MQNYLKADLILFFKISSKWDIALNTNHKFITFLEDNTGENLNDVAVAMTFYI